MSSVYGFYSSSISKSSSSTSLGISGLVSGLDIDSTVKAISSGTSSKISKVQQNLMKLQWKQEAYQDVATAMTDFKDKYMSSSGSSSISNLLKSAYSMKAENSDEKIAGAVTASGSATILENFSILGVSQLATNASFTTLGGVTSSSFASSAINFSEDGQDVSNLKGKTLTLSVGDNNFELTFGDTVVKDDASLQTLLQDAINNASHTNASGDGTKKDLKDLISVSVSGGQISFSKKTDSTDNIDISSSSNNSTVLKTLGLKPQSYTTTSGTTITPKSLNGSSVKGTAVDYSSMSSNVSFFSNLKGKDASVTFDLDGIKGTVKFDDDTLDAIKAAGDKAAEEAKTGGKNESEIQDAKNSAMLKSMVDHMNTQLKRSFGDKVSVKADENSGTFSISTSDASKSSILSVASGSSELVGTNGLLGIKVGDANRLLTTKKLEEANFADGRGFNFGENGESTYSMEINGVKIEVGKESITVDGKKTDYSKGVTTKNILDAINNSDANVKVSYLSTTDRFTINSTVSGVAGQIDISGNLSDILFGNGSEGSGTINSSTNPEGFTAGQDAKMLVSFDGNTVEEISRSTNSFSLDGLKLNLKSAFNTDYKLSDFTGTKDSNGNVTSAATRTVSGEKDNSITFSKSVDGEALTEALKTMVEDYNALIEKVTDYYTTKGDKDYQPLTADMIEQENLNDDQAEMYNDKAKEGVLFGDYILRTLQTDLMGIFGGLSSIGITTSSTYSDYGKLSFDESAFKAAAESDLDKVSNLLSTDETGALGKLDSLMKKYVNSSLTSPGLITKEAGLASSKLSQTQSSIYKEMTSLQDNLKSLESKKSDEEDRYYKRFTKMEVAISKYQSQSSYLGSMMF